MLKKAGGLLERKSAFDIFVVVFLTVWGLIIFFPFYNAVLISFVPQEVYIKTPFMLYPKALTFEYYKFVLSSPTLISGFKVTLIVVVLGVLYNMFLTVTTAYALSRPKLPGKGVIMKLIVFTMYFSGGLVPFYMLIRDLALIDKIGAMIIPMGINTFYMLIVRSYFQGLPIELEESAKIDGANEFIILFRIILPLSLPVLATFFLFYTVDRWNEWFNAMLFMKSIKKLPLQYTLRLILANISTLQSRMLTSESTLQNFSEGIKMACIVIIMTPVMILYPFVQKYFMKGLLIGAIKA